MSAKSQTPPADCETMRQRFGQASSDGAAGVATRETEVRCGDSDLPPALDESCPSRLGPYRVIRQLGRGGMGAVYLAEDTQLGRRAALKVMLPDVAADLRARERFL